MQSREYEYELSIFIFSSLLEDRLLLFALVCVLHSVESAAQEYIANSVTWELGILQHVIKVKDFYSARVSFEIGLLSQLQCCRQVDIEDGSS